MHSDKLEADTTNSYKEWGDIQHFLSLLWHWIWLIILLGAVSVGSAYFIFYRMTPVYETSTKILVIAAPAVQMTDNTSVLTSQNLVPTYADLVTNESILAEVIHRLGLAQSTSSLAGMIKVSPVVNTLTIKISVDGRDRAQIAQIANTLVAVFIEKINTIQYARFTSSQKNLQDEMASIDNLLQGALAEEAAATDPAIKSQLDAKVLEYRSMYATVLTNYEQARLAMVQTTSNVVQIGLAGTSYQQISPKTLLYTILAGLMGVMLAAVFVLTRDALDNTIKSADEITRCLKVPVLGIIYKHSSKAGLITLTKPRSPAADAFRSLRTNLQYADVDHPIRSILVTSPLSEEGKTSIAANLAVVLAQGEKKVLLMDADLHRPMVHRKFGLHNQVGLSDLFLPNPPTREVLQLSEVANLSIITSGALPPNPVEMLTSKKMAQILDLMRKEYDLILVDTPPVLLVTDATALASGMDGVLLVVRPGRTTLEAARQAVENLRRVNTRFIGVVLNNINLKVSSYRYYYPYSKK